MKTQLAANSTTTMSRVDTQVNPPKAFKARGNTWNFQDTAVKKIYGANGQLAQKVVLLRQKSCRTVCTAHADGNCCLGNKCKNFHSFVNEPWSTTWEHQDVVKARLLDRTTWNNPFDPLIAMEIMEFSFPLPKEPTDGDTLVKRV